jgi:hypothetical protein
MSTDTTSTIAIALVASVVLTAVVIGVAVLFATSPKARAIFQEILQSLPWG